LIAEHYLRYWQEAYGLAYTALRYGNVYDQVRINGEAGVTAIFARDFLHESFARLGRRTAEGLCHVGDVARAKSRHGARRQRYFLYRDGQRDFRQRDLSGAVEQVGYKPEIVAPKRSGDIHPAASIGKAGAFWMESRGKSGRQSGNSRVFQRWWAQ
jgi:UDP-glucose 4-epimerase